MKRTQIYILTISLFVVACHSDDINNKEKRNTHWDWWVDASTGKGKWIPLSDHPTWKNGTFTSFYYDGKIFEKGKIKDGKYIDTTLWFDREGKNYGYKIYIGDSAYVYIINDGPIEVFGDDGRITARGMIRNHTVGDYWTEYYKTGFIRRNISYKNDTGWLVRYYENQQMEDSEFIKGSTHTVITKWYENGQLATTNGWKNYNYEGECKDYYENGQLKEVSHYKDGKVDGEVKHWYSSGTLHDIGNFQMGMRNGRQISYFENGRIQLDVYMVDEKMDGEQKQYDSNGKIINDVFFKDGVKIK